MAETKRIKKILSEELKVKSTEIETLGSEKAMFVDVVDLVLKKIASRELSPSRKSDLMVSFHRDYLKPIIEKMTPKNQKAANFTVAKAVLDLEAFKPSDFKKRDYLSIVDKNMLYVHVEDFMPMTKSYIDGTSMYESLPSSGHGILGFTDIRDIESHIFFSAEYKGHDVRHIHFSNGHPYVIGMVWPAARSQNHVRYVLMGGLFEGVDTVQYWWENKLTEHFRNKGLNLQEALVEVALLSSAELKKLVVKVGAENVVEQLKDWSPTAKNEYTALGRYGRGMDYDVERAVRLAESNLKKEELKKYTNYSQHHPGAEGAETSDHSIH